MPEADPKATAPSVVLAEALEPVLQSLVSQAVGLLNGDGGGFYLSDPRARLLRCVVATGTPSNVLGVVLRYGEGAAGQVAETGEPVVIEDYRRWPGRSPQFEKAAPFRAVVSVPTLWQGRVTGVRKSVV